MTKNKSQPLIPIDLKNIIINENAYFYTLKKKIIDKDIQLFFDESLNDKKAIRKFRSIIREPFYNGSKAVAKFSLDIYEFRNKPPFLIKDVPGIFESKYGFFLIVEYEEYVAVIKKFVSGVKSLDDFIEEIDYNILSHFLVTQKSKFEKIVSSNMNTAENAIQRKVSEANDLKGILSQFGASKQILNSIRLDNDGEKHTVALNTSRVNSFKLKNNFDKVVNWMIDVLRLVIKANQHLPESSFINGFSKPLKFEDVIKELEPTYLLIRFGALKSDIDSQRIERCYKLDDKDNEINVDVLDLIAKNEKLFQLTKVTNTNYKSTDNLVVINQKSISLHNPHFKEIILDFGGGVTLSLNQYLNQGKHFLVNFDKIDYVYANHKIFKDSKLLGDLDNFFNTFITYTELKKIDSEKGTGYKASDTQFKPNSLFDFVENKLAAHDDILICDDLGTEWGDFISLNKDEIIFYHAKYKEESLSASDLEEVFGQAQKNFSALELTEEMIEYRKNRWGKTYNLDKVKTNITRIRKSPSGPDKIKIIKEFSNQVSSNPNLRRKVFVVVNFISKKKLQESIKELVKGKTFTNKGVTIQILWFVNSLLCSANELNTELRIICQE